MFCKHCGIKIEDNSSFCVNCGKPLMAETIKKPENFKGRKEKVAKINKKKYMPILLVVCLIIASVFSFKYVFNKEIKGKIVNQNKIVETAKTTKENIKEKQPVDIKISQIDTSDFPQIGIYFSILDESGDEILDFKKEKFSLVEKIANGKNYIAQEISAVKKIDENEYSNISLVMDISDSMNEYNNISYAKSSAKNFVESISLNEKNKISILSFNDEQNLLEDFTSDINQLSSSIEDLSAFGRTSLYDTLHLSLLQMNNRIGQKFIVAFTDGRDTSSSLTKDDVIKLSKELGIPIYIIGIGSDIDMSTLTTIAKESGGKYIPIENAQELDKIYLQIFEQQKKQMFITYTSKNLKEQTAWRNFSLKFEDNNYFSETEHQYIPVRISNSQCISNNIIEDIEASSYHIEKHKKESFFYIPENAIDGSYNTAWVENADGHGINEWIKLNFKGTYAINGVNFSNGYKKRNDLFYKNSRIKKLRMQFSDGTYHDIRLDDKFSYIDRIAFDNPKVTSSIKFIILEVYPGSKFDDTCITDIGIF
ncbi:VWA domain-containing protein [Lutibacter sp. B2]|nr:VWA domain-containing protein [Lutibacter sp. B2]